MRSRCVFPATAGGEDDIQTSTADLFSFFYFRWYIIMDHRNSGISLLLFFLHLIGNRAHKQKMSRGKDPAQLNRSEKSDPEGGERGRSCGGGLLKASPTWHRETCLNHSTLHMSTQPVTKYFKYNDYLKLNLVCYLSVLPLQLLNEMSLEALSMTEHVRQ